MPRYWAEFSAEWCREALLGAPLEVYNSTEFSMVMVSCTASAPHMIIQTEKLESP